jgi:thiamine biosynthesis lipoprotein
MRHIDFRAMNCEMSAVLDTERSELDALLQTVPAWFEAWEQTFSRFRADSELSQLNASSGQVFQASDDLWQMVHMAVQTARAHDGLVSPLVLDALKAVGYDKSFERIDALEKPAHGLRDNMNTMDVLTHIQCDADTRTIFLPQGVQLDLGGFVKGWCADAVVQRVSHYAPALMDAGGDIAISGAMADGGDWAIGIADPFDGEHDLAQVMVKFCGVATSGRDYRKWTQGGLSRHHIIDPRTGESAQTDVLCATVIALNTQQAELASKKLMILGAQAGMAWLHTQGGLGACVVLETGEMRMNSVFEQFMWQTPSTQQ